VISLFTAGREVAARCDESTDAVGADGQVAVRYLMTGEQVDYSQTCSVNAS